MEWVFLQKISLMLIFPRAKINIGLRITEKRSDGYHNLETIFYPAGLCDALEFVVSSDHKGKDEISFSGIAIDSLPGNNLVMKALYKMREFCTIPPLRIHLHKMIPAGAGLGGGSSDAAGFLKILNRYFCFRLNDKELEEAALGLGSDCPFFIYERPSYAEGRGEKLSYVGSLPEGLQLVILKPAFEISTRSAFEGCIPGTGGEALTSLYNLGIDEWKGRIFNDFEKTLFPKFPLLAELKKGLYDAGATYASMSGSGSAIYGIFKEKPRLSPGLAQYLIYSGAL